ncbi:Hsp70 family protein [Arthrobacter sp. YN]|uniref:Hsp70 family protein n=1 Tax=Arthrobacter sp. YN TaxID=2020486 RepID=UPI000B61CD08|nr:Hsp70 family protein [Arthrobacter sp. YN]ASN21435.1 molecular chaperone DnaK [Arthrobacter sp. YN]
MNYVLAIDVGTSFTAAALVKPDQSPTPTPEILPLGLHGSAVPSVLFYADDGRVLVGEAAERRGLDDPHHMVREFKRRIGDSIPLAVGEGWLAPEDVYATMARWVVDRAREREGAAPSSIIMTHPAAWGQHRTSVVLAALDVAGLQDITLISEPEAAALHYASQTRVEDGSIIAVYDLGGGTFDTAILRKAGAGNFELLGRPDGIETLGGADFDAAVLRHVMGHVKASVDVDPEAPDTLAALSRLRRECREAKEALSLDSESSVAVSLPGTQQSVRLVRAEFEALIEEPLRETVEALERSLKRVNVDSQDLSAVLLIGGSSRIPLVAEMISVELGRPIAVDADPKSSICLGAAVAGFRSRGEDAVDAAASATPGAAAAGVVASGALGRPHTAGRAPALGVLTAASAKPGRHAPRPRVRMAAAAAVAAAALTIATATAAQSPEGSGLLATVFGNQAADVMRDGGPQASGGQGSVAGGGKPGETLAVGKPAGGLEASARTGVTKAGKNPASTGTANAGTGSGAAVGPGAGSAAGPATGTSPGTSSGGTAASTPAAPGTGTPAAPGTTPAPTTPTPAPTGGAASGPTPPPVTPPTTPPPVIEPTTPPTTPADPVTPPPPPPPPPSPEPTVPQPEPTLTQDPPPPSPEPTPEPVTPPVTADPLPQPSETGPIQDPAMLSVV